MSNNTEISALAPAGGTHGMSSLLYATLLMAMIGPALVFVTLPPSLPLMAAFFGGGESGEAIAQTAQGLSFMGGAIGGLLAGTAIAFFGLRGVLLGAALAYAGGGSLSMLSSTSTQLWIGCLVVGVMGAVLSSGLATATGSTLIGAPRARMLGFQSCVSDSTSIFVGLLAGFMAQVYGWRAPFSVYIAFGVIVTILVFASKPRAAEPDVDKQAIGMLMALRLAWPVYASAILFSLLITTQQIQLPFHLEAFGMDRSSDRSIVQTAGTVMSALCSLTFGLTIRWFGERGLILIGAIFAAFGFVGFTLWQGGLTTAAVSAGSVGVATGLGIPLLFTFALRRVPPACHGYGVGVLNTAIFLGGAIGPLLFIPLTSDSGTSSLFAICAALSIVGGIGIAMSVVLPVGASFSHPIHAKDKS